MITKISAVNPNFKAQSVQKAAPKSNVQAENTKSVSLSGANMANMFQAMNGIQTAKTVSFGKKLQTIAQQNDYKTYAIHICVLHQEISIARVQQRVQKGGHDVFHGF